MQLIEHYVRLYQWLLPRLADKEAEVSLSELSDWLHCTERNVKLLLRGMRKQQWIEWQPGRGRGRKSRLLLTAEPEELVLSHAGSLLHAGRLQDAIGLAEQAPLTERGRGRFHVLLQEALGYRKEAVAGTASAEVLRFPSYRALGSLDPAFATRRTELHMIRQLFDTLVVYDREAGRFVPGLAHHWEEERAPRGEGRGCIWHFYLQKHVMFHHGVPFTAQDAARTFERLMDRRTGSPYSPLYAPILSVVCPDEHHLIVRLKHPYPALLSLLSSVCASIVPAERADDYDRLPAGTGPFRLSRREERLLVLEAYPEYYGRAAHLDRVEMWHVPEDVYEGRIGQDELGSLNFRHYWERRYATHGEGWREVQCTDRGCKYILFNTRKAGPLQHAAHRERVSWWIRSIPEEEPGLGQEGNQGPLALRFIRDLEAGEESGLYRHEATSTENDAPLRDSRPLKLLTYAGAGHERDASRIRQALHSEGIEVEIVLVPYDRILIDARIEEADLLLLEQPVDEDEEWTLLTLLANPHSPLRRCLPETVGEEIDRLLAGCAEEPSRSRRIELLLEAERVALLSRAVIVWYRWQQAAAFPPALRGVTISSFGWVNYKDLWFAGSPST
ncbi:ABC transporter substrate-binding protein [Paenibacillus allorhizosphaerae]|uniref:HTH-type transcriptional regulator SgrR n=1 Tax=Paenibacillus allorhizosphaerae TaxID=2849866 RepID=A0ABN7TVA5_9BACL|nr:ABC transporter substrate-binding protein [Paenibacillus allorhizosphaerae]CAG7653532.1 HTH-type transcriptional regulator SgrR [Paenibacillus allorhizosphaerae]